MDNAGKNTTMPEHAPVPGLYQHYKGQRYQVLGTARHSETEEWLVVYQALYGEQGYWVRPLSLWQEPVSSPGSTDGTQERFELIHPNERSLDQASERS